jgi:hypothetical protein
MQLPVLLSQPAVHPQVKKAGFRGPPSEIGERPLFWDAGAADLELTGSAHA